MRETRERYAPLALSLILTLSACVATGSVKVVKEEDAVGLDPARAAEIAVALVAPLRRVERSLARWETCLHQQSCAPEAFLSQTETALLEVLNAPELGGLRDWVHQELRGPTSTIR